MLIRRPDPGVYLRTLTWILAVAYAVGCDRPAATLTPMSPTPTENSAVLPTVAWPAATSTMPLATSTKGIPNSGPAVRQCVLDRARHYAANHTLYRLGHAGPTFFDCTGLVYRVFADCSAADLIGATGEQPVRAYYDWFAAIGEADAIPPQPGDLIVYGEDFRHVAIYTGDGKAISALLEGVREHDAVIVGSGSPGERMPVKAYLHIQWR